MNKNIVSFKSFINSLDTTLCSKLIKMKRTWALFYMMIIFQYFVAFYGFGSSEYMHMSNQDTRFFVAEQLLNDYDKVTNHSTVHFQI